LALAESQTAAVATMGTILFLIPSQLTAAVKAELELLKMAEQVVLVEQPVTQHPQEQLTKVHLVGQQVLETMEDHHLQHQHTDAVVVAVRELLAVMVQLRLLAQAD
jgi:hypothetical protein